MHDVRSHYKERIRLELGAHKDTVKSVVFSKQDSDFLCLTGGSDCMLKLWDLRMRKCIGDYGGNEGDVPYIEWGMFHSDSIWTIEPTQTFETCFTGGRDGKIFHTDLVREQHTLLYSGNNNPITSIAFDEQNQQLWFTSANDSSLRSLDLQKRNIEKLSKQNQDAGVGEQPPKQEINSGKAQVSEFSFTQPDYELQGLPQLTDYHMLKNKRYVVTNNSLGTPQLWSIDQCKLVKSYQSKSFE